MHYYFDSYNRLHISGSDYTPEIKRIKSIKELYKFDQIILPLGGGFSQFLNADIEAWGNNFKTLLLEMINNYNEGNIHEYIAQAKALFTEIPYFSVYHVLFYDEILLFYKHTDILLSTCKKIYEFLESKEVTLPQNLPYPLSDNSKPVIFRGEIDRLKEIQIRFTELTQLCLSPNINNPLKELHDIQEKIFNERAYMLGQTDIAALSRTSENLIRFEIDRIGKGKYEAVEVHTTNDVYGICYREFIKLALNNVRVKQCGNNDCKKYFVPPNRADTLYCDDCKSAGIAMKIYQNKVKENPVLTAYKKAYQSKYAKLVKPCIHEDIKRKRLKVLQKWANDAKTKIAKLDTLKDEERVKATEEIILWLNEREV